MSYKNIHETSLDQYKMEGMIYHENIYTLVVGCFFNFRFNDVCNLLYVTISCAQIYDSL